MIYICEGNDKEKLDWFKTINIAGEQLTNQELRNAIYKGEWLTEAKKYFSKTGCAATQIADKYLNGSAIRQDYLETALSWICNRDNMEIEDYMVKHQHGTNCNEL
jgi:putative HNH endonuclease domain protein